MKYEDTNYDKILYNLNEIKNSNLSQEVKKIIEETIILLEIDIEQKKKDDFFDYESVWARR